MIKLYEALGIKEEALFELDKVMSEISGKKNIVKEMEGDLNNLIEEKLKILNLDLNSSAEDVTKGLLQKIEDSEEEIYQLIGTTREDMNEEKIRVVAENVMKKKGFFIKKEKISEILTKRPPIKVLNYLGYSSVKEMLSREDLVEVFSSLRFIESNEWMHETFKEAYSNFSSHDFEERPVELKILDEKWRRAGQDFSAKKHHNVSHLKEFGVVFLNPVNQSKSGALLRDFALFFHYFHEIIFYSQLFKLHCDEEDFNLKLKSFLRGDIPEKNSVEEGEWLIIQRYLWKENPLDLRLGLPRVNPESLHWRKGEEEIIYLNPNNSESLKFWKDLDWVAGSFKSNGGEELISFDLEDNAMTFVYNSEGREEKMNYHQREAVWNELFVRYMGEESLEELLIKNFHKGVIQLENRN